MFANLPNQFRRCPKIILHLKRPSHIYLLRLESMWQELASGEFLQDTVKELCEIIVSGQFGPQSEFLLPSFSIELWFGHQEKFCSLLMMPQDENKFRRRRRGTYHRCRFETGNRYQATSPNSCDGLSNKRPATGSSASCTSQPDDRQGMDTNAGLVYGSSSSVWEGRVHGGLQGWSWILRS